MTSAILAKHELKRRRWSLLWWSLGTVVYIWIVLASYGLFESQAASLAKAFKDLPQSLNNLFAGGLDFVSPAGFLSSNIYYLMLPLLFSVLAIGLGTSLLGKEEKQHTLELLLARPVSRLKLFWSKAAAGAAILLIINLVVMVVTLGLCKFYGVDVGLANIAFVHLGVMVFAAVLGSLAYCLTAWGGFWHGSAIGITSLVGLSGYLFDSTSSNLTWLATPAKLLPFHYLPTNAALEGSFLWKDLAILAIASSILLIVGYLGFRHRDVY